MAVVPAPDVLASWATLRDAAQWAGVDEGTKRAFCRQLGDPDLDSLLVLAVVPPETVDNAMNAATKGARPLNVVEKSLLVIMMAAVKAKFNVTTTAMGSLQAPPGFTAGTGPPDTNATSSSSTKVKVKLSQVIDQGSDQETEMLPMEDLQKLRSNYVLSDGTKKARLVHDLRRSRVNEFITCEERLVLPRIKDAEEDILKALEERRPSEKVEVWSLDFSDAFKQLPVRHQEKRFLAGRTLKGFFIYHTVLFGIKTGPLVWGRMAALIARLTQSALSKGSLQIYVDDPLLTLRGAAKEIEEEMARATLLWSLLGLKIAFHKGTRGTLTEWVEDQGEQ